MRCDRGGECVGIARASKTSPLDLRVHIHIPKGNRVSCLKIGKAFMSHLEAKKGSFLKLSTRIACKYENVVKFAQKLGFDVDGIDRLSYQRDGVIYDTVMMSYIFKG